MAATVHIDLKKYFETGFQAWVVFEHLNAPFIYGTQLIPSGSQAIQTDEDGEATILLVPGTYCMRFRGVRCNEDEFIVGVPDDELTHELTALINQGVTIPNPPPPYATPAQGVLADAAAINAAKLGITDLVGGLSNHLDAYVTVGKGSLLFFVNSVTYRFGQWEKIMSTAPEDIDNGILHPLDHNPATNPYVWIRRQ